MKQLSNEFESASFTGLPDALHEELLPRYINIKVAGVGIGQVHAAEVPSTGTAGLQAVHIRIPCIQESVGHRVYYLLCIGYYHAVPARISIGRETVGKRSAG